MRPLMIVMRLALTIAMLAALLVWVVPAGLCVKFAPSDQGWLVLAIILGPAFIACRYLKWASLENQAFAPGPRADSLRRYLWGIAVGLLTPGRIGELARLGRERASARGAGLFFLEKAVEVSCLLCLCVPGLAAWGVIPYWMAVPAALIFALIILRSWRGLIRAAMRLLSRLTGRPAGDRRQNIDQLLGQLRLGKVVLLSITCFVIYIVQAYAVLRGGGAEASIETILLFPLVLTAHLVPVTIGGYGIREALAVVILQKHQISQSHAIVSVALVTFIDLIVPALLGVLLQLQQGFAAARNVNRLRRPETGGGDEEWDVFWEARRRKPLGRLLAWLRQRYVTRKLAAYLVANTERGTLIEAGCGSGEIALQVAAARGDSVVLVDSSQQALELAKGLARRYGVEARLVRCDVCELHKHVSPRSDATVYNVGVIEHYEDPGAILSEMARVSGRNAIAVIPQRSIFWLVFFQISRLLRLVPKGFFVRFLSRKQLLQTVRQAGLTPQWIRSVRVFGIIPYLGVGYTRAGQPAENRNPIMIDPMSPPELTVITPMYNEQARISDSIRRIRGALEALHVAWEYILVDDGSTDESLARAQEAIGDDARCSVIHYRTNRGRGYALRQGFEAARGKYVITTESDLTWGEDIIALLYGELVKDTDDIIIASVYQAGGGLENVPLARRFLSSGGNVIMRWCMGGELTMLSGMTRGYRREAIKRLHLESHQKEIHLEIVAKAQALQMRIREIPARIRWSPTENRGRRAGLGSMARFIVPHLSLSFVHGSTRLLTWSMVLLAGMGSVMVAFGLANKVFLIMPPALRMGNIVTYGLVLILMAGMCALFGGISLQLGALARSITHIQAQLRQIEDRQSQQEQKTARRRSYRLPGVAESAEELLAHESERGAPERISSPSSGLSWRRTP